MRQNHAKTTLLLAGLFATPLSQAATLSVDHADIKLTGGLAGGVFYSTNHAGNDAADASRDVDVTDMLAELSMDPGKGGVGFTAGLGRFVIPNVLDGGKNRIYSDAFYKFDTFNLQYGYVSVVPITGLSVDAGILVTNVGYEAVNTMKNPNITTSALWNGQPAYYPGARATYAFSDSLRVYVEGNNLEFVPGQQNRGSAYGVLGSIAGINYTLNYMVMNDYKEIADLILSGHVAGMDVGLNADFNKLQNCSAPCEEKTPWGIALYITPKLDKMSYPIRLEYINDGGGAYLPRTGVDMKNAYTLTITPTYHYSDSTFVRVELSYVGADRQAFIDDDGATKDNKISAAIQAGVTF